MFGKIKFIAENTAHVETAASAEQMGDLMNVHVVFEAPDQEILGEVEEINDGIIKIRFLGEFHQGKYISGVIRKPVMSSTIRTINDAELKAIVGVYDETTFKVGTSSIYKGYEVCADINNLFANHMAVFGNTGSGKSCGVARIVQNIFSNPKLISYNANIFIFDAYGEYKTAFANLNQYNPNYSYKFITTNIQEETDYPLQIPFHLLNLDDLTIMLQADKHSQIPILERALKLTRIFSKNDKQAEEFKNHLIAKALMAILYSNQITANKRNEIPTKLYKIMLTSSYIQTLKDSTLIKNYLSKNQDPILQKQNRYIPPRTKGNILTEEYIKKMAEKPERPHIKRVPSYNHLVHCVRSIGEIKKPEGVKMNPKMRTNQNSINSYENYKHLRTYKMPDTLKNFYFDDFNSIKQNQYDMSKYNSTVSK